MPGLDEHTATTTTFDVVVVGAGPSGAACAHWLARAGWSVALVEKKLFPREKTCGDGLTPRAVHQLAAMGLEEAVAAHGHRYGGLRGFGFGASVEMAWPAHPVFPSHGYTITRLNLDGLVATEAARRGAVLLTGVEALALLDPVPGPDDQLAGAAGVVVADKASGAHGEVRGRYVVVADGQNSRLGRELGTTRNRAWPMGMALRGYYTSERHAEPWIDSHLDIRDPHGQVVPGYGWIFPLGDGRVNVGVGLLSTDGAWKGVNTTKLQEYFVGQVGEAWGLNEGTREGAPTGGRLPMGLSIGPRVGPNTLVIGDAAGAVNPFNGEGIAYAYETGRLAAGALGEALASGDAATLALYEERLDAAYEEYYKVARVFVRVISEPRVLSACVGLGMRVAPLMRELLKIMANLMSNQHAGPGELGYRALSRLADVVPEGAYQLLTADAARAPVA
ncbi:MAG: geranylgeranyl reductase family protein [Acidimicrobiales bacterium]